MKTVIITFRNGTKLCFEPKNGIDIRHIEHGSAIVFDNLWVNTDDVVIIEVKENG